MKYHSTIEKGPQTEVGRTLSFGTTRAALASGTAQMVTRVLTLVLSVATARALEPREVGILGLAVIIVGVISMIGYYPETAAVAARGDGDHEEYAVASVVVRALVIALLLASLAIGFPLAAHYLTGSEGGAVPLRELIIVLALAPLLETISGYPRVLLQRRLDLNYVSAAGLVQPVLFVGLAVVLLWYGYGALGVAWASVAGTTAATLLSWWRVWSQGWVTLKALPPRAVWLGSLTGAFRVFAGGFGGFLGERVDNILVSGAIGPTAMSFYSMSWNGSRTPANLFGSTIGFVLVPTLARIQDEPARIERAIRESLRHSYFLLAPTCAALFVTAPLLVTNVLGAKWLPLVPCFRVMCITVVAIPILHACNSLLVSSGRAHLTGISTAVHLVALVTLIPVFARRWYLLGAAYGDLSATFIMTLVLGLTAGLATRQFKWNVLAVLALPIGAALFAGVLSWSVASYFDNGFVRLAAQVTVCLGGYLLFIIALGGRAALFDLVALLRGAARRMSAVAESRA